MEARGSLRAFINYYKVGRKAFTYYKEISPKVEGGGIRVVFKVVETSGTSGIGELGSAG